MTTHDDAVESWVERRATLPVPDGFTDRVMAGVERADGSRRASSFLVLWTAVLTSRAGRVVLLALAGAVFAMHVAGALSLFAAH